VTTIQGAYLSDEVGAEVSVQRRMRYQPALWCHAQTQDIDLA
jgi:hypothetical protein